MTSTHGLINGEQPEHASVPGFLDSKSEPGSANAPSAAPDVAYEKEVSQNTTDDHGQRQEEPKPDDAKPNEYPSSARSVCIVLILVLAIVLVSLDLTIVPTTPWTFYGNVYRISKDDMGLVSYYLSNSARLHHS